MAQAFNVGIVSRQVLQLLPGLNPRPILFSLLLLFDLVLLRAVVKELLVHFHEQLQRVIDQAVDGLVPAKRTSLGLPFVAMFSVTRFGEILHVFGNF